MPSTLQAALRFLARPVLLFYALPWLMLLLTLGTVAQRYAGLYGAERLFFGAFFLWIGPVPLPGAYATLGLIAASIACKLLINRAFTRRGLGTLLTHGSVLLLLGGGVVTALGREEGYVTLLPGASADAMQDYRDKQLVITKDDAQFAVLTEAMLRRKTHMAGLTPLHYCHACNHAHEEESATLRALFQPPGIARPVAFLLEAVPLTITIGQDRYRFTLSPAARPLPFQVTLLRFDKDDYPGTDMAQSYRSDIAIRAGALAFTASIAMNAPFSYGGYTLYQSSFFTQDGKQGSVLAVVRNAGKAFPYFAIALLCGGMALQLAHAAQRKR